MLLLYQLYLSRIKRIHYFNYKPNQTKTEEDVIERPRNTRISEVKESQKRNVLRIPPIGIVTIFDQLDHIQIIVR